MDISFEFLEQRDVTDYCLKRFPILSFIFLTSLLIGFFLPEPIKLFTGIFSFFATISGAVWVIYLFGFIIVKPIFPSMYEKHFNSKE